ncbi:hypothetical protein JCM17846_13270 [Iodidimonas nitroreducens]|uniref:Polyprenyl synthetase n=1 Tax=Iodidimonas nitroreducens TaxID=1236968 RepID=A0A5A7N7M9_9PROT|nr:hypothetical protein JCM17846_13270 [Iodidimonas nitroreducens]
MGKATGKDAAAGKATLVSLWGEDAAREKAEILTDQALSYLKEFGSKAELLREVAQFAIHRRR